MITFHAGTVPNFPGPNTLNSEPPSYNSPAADVTRYGMRLSAEHNVANTPKLSKPLR